MSSHPQRSNLGSPSESDVVPIPRDPAPVFKQNQARRAGVSAELEALSCSFLERPTVEGLEAFVEKNTEWNKMMAEMIGYYRTATQEQHVHIQSSKRAAERAEECRLQEYRHALERMDPAEAEAAQQAERERALRLEKEREVRAAELNAGLARARARAREQFMEDNQRDYNRS